MDTKQKKDANDSSSKLVLYSSWMSSCSWRIRFALHLKGLPYEYKAAKFSTELQKLNPLGYVPVLVDGDIVVSDSFAIFLYLEDKYPVRTLLPADPQKRALNFQVSSVVTSSIQPLHMLGMLKHMEEKVGHEESWSWAQSNIQKGFQALEVLLKDVATRYATGEKIYMADVFLAPQIAVATKRFGVDMSEFPTLSRIYESYEALPEFKASSPEKQPDFAVI